MLSTIVKSPAPKRNDSKGKYFSVGLTTNGMLEINSPLPKGLTIGRGEFGRSIVATDFFAKGAIMYRGYAALINSSISSADKGGNHCDITGTNSSFSPKKVKVDLVESYANSPVSEALLSNAFLLNIYTCDGELLESTVLDEINSVEDSVNPTEKCRQVYGFDGFMNHSCSPNCSCPKVYRTNDTLCYIGIAERNIYAGDEVTCDYALFDYECDGHAIAQCGCKSENCRGNMMGFKDLPLCEKVRIMHQCDDEIVDRFLKENPNITLFDSNLPKDIKLVCRDYDETFLVAGRKFEEGAVVYKNQASIIPLEELSTKIFILKLDGHFFLMDHLNHFIHRPSYVEVIGFDIFQDHSCDANTIQNYHDMTTYTVYAKRLIEAGERLTIDYGDLKNKATNVEHIPSTSFICKCGSPGCMGVIVA